MTTPAREKITPWLLLIGLCLLIFWQSSAPLPVQTPTFPGLDKLVHAVVYAFVAILAARAFATLPFQPHPHALLGAAVLFASLYGLGDEVHQSFVPGRTADVWDLAADIVGAFAGAFLYRWRMRTRSHRQTAFLR
ncbi:MAG: VanZ family protein [Desulfosarcina sp.]|nr:VanZ family protein [Desulfobacterales bacterium]